MNINLSPKDVAEIVSIFTNNTEKSHTKNTNGEKYVIAYFDGTNMYYLRYTDIDTYIFSNLKTLVCENSSIVIFDEIKYALYFFNNHPNVFIDGYKVKIGEIKEIDNNSLRVVDFQLTIDKMF